MKPVDKTPKYWAEAAGTFFLVFAGTGAVIVNGTTGGRLGVVGIALVFGLVVMALVYSLGHVSGAHFNPAVTLGFYSAGRFPAAELPAYLGAQCAGALAASALLRLLFWTDGGSLGMTLPSGPVLQSFGFEFVMTALLMFVIMGSATDHRAQGGMAGASIGAVIALEAIFGGPVSGASMNPARSLAPALVCGNWTSQWLYCAAPVLGALAGAKAYLAVRCDPSQPEAEPASGCC